MRIVFLPFLLLTAGNLIAQDGLVTVEVPLDTVGVGQTFSVKWTVHDRPDSIVAPVFGTIWQSEGGPFKSGSYAMKNGVATNSVSWSYSLHASAPGLAPLPDMQVRVNGQWYNSPSVRIVVTLEPQQNITTDARLDPSRSGNLVPNLVFYPVLVMIHGREGSVSLNDPNAKSSTHDLSPDELTWLIERFQELLRTPADRLTGITRLTATLGKTGGSVGMDTAGGRRSYQLTPKQAKKLEAAIRKILKKY